MKWYEHTAWFALVVALVAAFVHVERDWLNAVPGALMIMACTFLPSIVVAYGDKLEDESPDPAHIARLEQWMEIAYGDPELTERVRAGHRVEPLPGHGTPYTVIIDHAGHVYHKYDDGRMVVVSHYNRRRT